MDTRKDTRLDTSLNAPDVNGKQTTSPIRWTSSQGQTNPDAERLWTQNEAGVPAFYAHTPLQCATVQERPETPKNASEPVEKPLYHAEMDSVVERIAKDTDQRESESFEKEPGTGKAKVRYTYTPDIAESATRELKQFWSAISEIAQALKGMFL